jgi:precorrin-8X/cobalt-precorrin-8 methylmutase
MQDYVRDPAEIYRRSFATIRAEADFDPLPADIAAIAARLIHACGMTDIVADLRYSADVARCARAALAGGAPVITDGAMTAAGIIRDRLPASNDIVCTLHDDGLADRAAARRTTRSAAAVDLWRPRLAGAVVAIGNAPTALFRLLEVIAAGAARPAAILAFPVGFVGAAEAKDALVAADDMAPYLTLCGRRGGSAMAAAAVNALGAGMS